MITPYGSTPSLQEMNEEEDATATARSDSHSGIPVEEVCLSYTLSHLQSSLSGGNGGTDGDGGRRRGTG